MDPRFRTLQAYSRLSQLVFVSFYITRSSCTGGAVLLPPLTLAPKIMLISSAWHAVNEEWERAWHDRPCPWHMSPSALFFPKAHFLAAACDMTIMGNLAWDKCVTIFSFEPQGLLQLVFRC